VRVLAGIIVALVACGGAPEPDTAGPAKVLAEHQLPEWTPLPMPNPTTAKPAAWKADGRPTLFLFSASWCTSCYASVLTDVELARTYGDNFQVGVGLVENDDAEFSKSAMARLFADVPVWSASSVQSYAAQCAAQAIPLVCLVDRGRVVFRGSADRARGMLDAFTAGKVGDAVAADAAAKARTMARLGVGLAAEDIPELVTTTRGDPVFQNSIAWLLAARTEASPTDLALAVALARDAVATDGGVNFLHLDTYSLALSKAGLSNDAAAVSWRVLTLCRTVSGECMIEKRRAYAYIYYARERGLPNGKRPHWY
jgi:hypothetical protein